VTISTATLSPALHVRALPRAEVILRLGASLCFIGHGAFGFITKAAWLPYFGLAGIPESVAWQLMPWIGAVDVFMGIAVLFAPWRLAAVYMVIWGTWTALLRPLAGESIFEAVERAGNYGVPLALLVMAGPRHMWGRWDRTTSDPRTDGQTPSLVCEVLRWTTCLLLAGHGALGVTGKEMLTAHYAAIGLPPATTMLVGWFELVLAARIAVVRPTAAVFVFVAAWKLGTESLFLFAGDPIWEVVERAGSYAAPLALAVLLRSHIQEPSEASVRARSPT
jgi:hypothetical protein